MPPGELASPDVPLDDRLAWVERAEGRLVAAAHGYPDGHHVRLHRHRRSQLLHARLGVVQVSTDAGRWLVPSGHAIWLPGGVEHSVDMLGDVAMMSVYVEPDASERLPVGLKVFGMTALMTSLLEEAVRIREPEGPLAGERDRLVAALLLDEITRLPERPLVLPLPGDRRLAALCRDFMASPSPHAPIDQWARSAGMSRRSFTRHFLRETGLSLETWRQQACLFAALPRLADGEPVTRVALDLGYESVPAFTTMFRRMLGATPRSYRRQGFGTRRPTGGFEDVVSITKPSSAKR